MRKTLKEALRSLYEAMLKDNGISVLKEENYCCMAPSVGEKYPKMPNEGIVFYGRANNGWTTGVDDSFDTIYDDGAEGLTDYIKGNSSPFFRTAGKAFSNYYGEEWYEHVAYSNLYKVAPHSGNPTNTVCGTQWEYITEIFKKEIKTLSPKFVVMFAGKCWADDFVWYVNGEKMPEPLETIEWDKNYGYEINIYKIEEVYYLITEHPQGKNETLHAQAIIEIIEKYK